MKRLGMLILIVCVGGFLFQMLFPSVTFRYRLVLDATDGAKNVTGSSVLSVTFTKDSPFVGDLSRGGSWVTGEAMTLPLHGDRTLVMLLAPGGQGRSDPGSILSGVFKLNVYDLLNKPFVRTPVITGSRPLPPELLPLIVMLDDAQKPTSARYVPVLQFPARADRDVSITGVSIEMIDDGIWPLTIFGVTGTQPTRGIELKLPWLVLRGVLSREALLTFWQAITSSGYQRSGSMELTQLFKRG